MRRHGKRVPIGFDTALDLYSKVVRDQGVCERRVTPDALFNFVVTAHSLCDWARKDLTLPTAVRSAVTEFEANNEWVRACRDLANGNKHFDIDRYVASVEHADAVTGFGIGRFGKGPFGKGEWRIIVSWNGVAHDAMELVDQVVEAWRAFFQSHGVDLGEPTA